MSIEKQISMIKNEIKDKADLVAVSKTRSIQEIQEAYNSGQLKFGENRVQEIVDKQSKLPNNIEWHMIGHLQKNKVKYIAKFINLIHSVDRISLAKEIDKHAKKENRKIDCLVQLKISKEESKFGLQIEDFKNFYESLQNYKNLNIIGLMCIPPVDVNPTNLFKEMSELNNSYNFQDLSMGMSSDYIDASRNNATYLRIGSSIFGARS